MASFLCGKTLPGTLSVLAVLIAAAPPVAAGANARLAWTSYIGDHNETQLARIAVDAAGNTYAVGNRVFRQYTSNFSNSQLITTTDVLVVKLDAAGQIVYTTYLGGKGTDVATGIAVDGAGNAWITGNTSSQNFPLRNPLQTQPAGGFIAKLSPEGYVLFSTYWGMWKWDQVNAVAVDSSGAAYVTGETFSPEFPVTPGAFQTTAAVSPNFGPVRAAAFVSKISASGRLVYSTYLGGSGYCSTSGSHCIGETLADVGTAITVDAAGEAFVAGYSNRGNLPATPGAIQQNTAAVFVAKLNAAGSGLVYLTGLGGSLYGPYKDWQYDAPTAIAVDPAGNAYVAGRTASSSFPTQSPLQAAFGGPIPNDPYTPPPHDGFISKINPTGTALIYSTFYGGPGEDLINGISVDPQGNAWITGTSQALSIAADTTLPQGSAFVIELNPAGSGLLYSTRLPNGAAGTGLALDALGKVHLGGWAGLASVLEPATSPSRTILGLSNAAAPSHASTLVSPNELVAIWGQGLGPATPAFPDGTAGFPKSAADTQVFFDEFPAPLLYVSDRQINSIVPSGIAGRTTTRLRGVYKGETTKELRLALGSAAGEIFKNADGSAAALNQDGSTNSPSNPARPGSIVAVYATPSGGECVDGAINPLNVSGLSGLKMGGLEVTYLGPAPALVCGIYQINFRLPDSANLQGNKYYIPLFDNPSEQTYLYVAQ